MTTTVTLSAESKYGYSGQYIAHIVGRAERVQFNREFVGRRYGKRNESSSHETDETGLYEECDVDKHGKKSSFVLVLPWKDGIRKLYSDKEDALTIAKRLDAGERLEEFVVVELGEPMTDSQGYRKCNTCDHEVADGEKCTEHPDGMIVHAYRQVPKLSDAGKPMHKLTYTIKKSGEVKKEQATATLDAAVDAIVAALSALPAPLQKKALALAKEKLFPKSEPQATPEAQS